MNNKSFLIIVIQSLLILILIWLLILVSKDELFDDDELEEEIIVDYTQVDGGLTYVILSEAVEKNSNIKVEPIQKTTYEKEISSHGEVIDTNQLIELGNLIRKHHLILNKLKLQIDDEQSRLEKYTRLNQDNKNISDKVVREQEILVNGLKNEYEISGSEIQLARNTIQYNWGSKLDEIISNSKKNKHCLLLQECSLAQIIIDSNKFNQDLPNILALFNMNDQKNYQGVLLGPSTKLNRSIQGEGFYYLIQKKLLPPGSKLIIKLVPQKTSDDYLFIPKESVVWSHGKQWVYIRNADAPKFLRKPLENPHETENGWLIKQSNLRDGDYLVVDGAQLLLSEEFKYQIKNENED